MTDQALTDWVSTVCTAMDIDPAAVDVDAVLDLARDAAHGIARPAAPLTTFMAGFLAGRASVQGKAAPGSGELSRAALTSVAGLVPPPPSLSAQP